MEFQLEERYCEKCGSYLPKDKLACMECAQLASEREILRRLNHHEERVFLISYKKQTHISVTKVCAVLCRETIKTRTRCQPVDLCGIRDAMAVDDLLCGECKKAYRTLQKQVAA